MRKFFKQISETKLIIGIFLLFFIKQFISLLTIDVMFSSGDLANQLEWLFLTAALIPIILFSLIFLPTWCIIEIVYTFNLIKTKSIPQISYKIELLFKVYSSKILSKKIYKIYCIYRC